VLDPSVVAPTSDIVEISNMHRQFALWKYGKAVNVMQGTLPQAEPRSVLIAALLVFIFEMTLDNSKLFVAEHFPTLKQLLFLTGTTNWQVFVLTMKS
jgi:hypothetical protein